MPHLKSLMFIAIVFLFAGWVKGVVGMGLPTVAMGVLGLIMAPVQAASLLVVPSLVTNVWQFVTGPSKLAVIRRLASMMLFVCVGTGLGIRFLTSGSSRGPSAALGAILVAYGLLALFLPKLAVSPCAERPLSPIVGAVTGFLTGATGVFVVPAVPYLSAMSLDKNELIQALGLSFTVSTVALAIGLGSSGSYSTNILFASACAVVPALAGMFVGQRMRERIDPITFRKWFFIALLLVGGYMVIQSLARSAA